MPKLHINALFEYCKKGKTQALIDGIKKTDNANTNAYVLDERQNSLLATALKHGQWQTALCLIENNFTFCHADKPALIAASQYPKDDVKGILIALELDTNINVRNLQQRTAIMTVCLLGHVNKAQELIQHNANINLQDQQGNTALMDAILSNNKKIIEFMLQHDNSINLTNNQGAAALILELQKKSPAEDIVSQLLQAGSDVEPCDHNKQSAWLLAKQKHPKIARLIETHLNKVNQIELPFFSNDYQPIENNPKSEANEATKQHDLSQQQPTNPPVIEDKPSPNTTMPMTPTEQEDSTPEVKTDTRNAFIFSNKAKKTNQQEWFHAAKIGNLGSLNRMILEGIDIDCIDDKGCTALIRASGHSRRAVVSFLLQQKANIEARSFNGSTALSSSIIGNCRRVAGLLLDNGADVHALGPADYSYMTIAAAAWNDAMLSILYRYGGDIFVSNKTNQSLLHIIALAAEYYNNINNAKNAIQYLVEHGIDINAQDNNGNTALMLIAGIHKKNYPANDRNIAAIAHCLIKLKAGVAITNKSSKSALDAARTHKLQQTIGVINNALSWND